MYFSGFSANLGAYSWVVVTSVRSNYGAECVPLVTKEESVRLLTMPKRLVNIETRECHLLTSNLLSKKLENLHSTDTRAKRWTILPVFACKCKYIASISYTNRIMSLLYKSLPSFSLDFHFSRFEASRHFRGKW